MEVEQQPHYHQLKYRHLQKLAKERGLKANLGKEGLIEALLKHDAEHQKEAAGRRSSAGPPASSALNVTFEKEQDGGAHDNQPANSSRFVEFTGENDGKGRKRRSRTRSIETPTVIVASATTRRSSTQRVEKPPAKSPARSRKSAPLSAGRQAKRTPAAVTTTVGRAPVPGASTPRSVGPKMGTPRNSLLRKSLAKEPASGARSARQAKAAAIKSQTQIPRFVSFSRKAGKVPDFTKMHEKQFDRMESLDTYLDKKRKRTETIQEQFKRAKVLAEEHVKIVDQLKAKTPASKSVVGAKSKTPSSTAKPFVPVATTTAKLNLNFGSSSSSSTPGRDVFKFTAQQKPAQKAARKTRTPLKTQADRRSAAKAGKTPLAGTPLANKPLTNITNKSVNASPKKNMFDLKASLAKPLGYKPHTGKLKPWETKKAKSVADKTGGASVLESKDKARATIRGVRMNKRAELLMKNRKMED